jgi:hypothetical protein
MNDKLYCICNKPALFKKDYVQCYLVESTLEKDLLFKEQDKFSAFDSILTFSDVNSAKSMADRYKGIIKTLE